MALRLLDNSNGNTLCLHLHVHFNEIQLEAFRSSVQNIRSMLIYYYSDYGFTNKLINGFIIYSI